MINNPTSFDMNRKPPNNMLSPRVYCGELTIGNTNGTPFTMSPGVYIMASGGLTINGQAIVSGTGVTVYNTASNGWGCSANYNYRPVAITGQVTATLSAPTSGSLNGILFFADRTGCTLPGSCQDQFNGGSNTILNGALYFASDQINPQLGRIAINPHFRPMPTDASGHGLVETPERLTAVLPMGAVELGRPFEIPVNFTSDDVAQIWVQMSDDRGPLFNKSAKTGNGDGTAKVVAESERQKTIEIIPVQTGQIRLGITALFADGSIAQQSYPLQVVAPANGVAKFALYHGEPALSIILDENVESGQIRLVPEVECPGVAYPIYLRDATQVKLKVEQPKEPVVTVENDGLIRGLRPGRAVISGTFGGISTGLHRPSLPETFSQRSYSVVQFS